MHAIVWKIREILLQIFAWIVDLKAREHLTGYLRKDIKHRQANIGMHQHFDIRAPVFLIEGVFKGIPAKGCFLPVERNGYFQNI